MSASHQIHIQALRAIFRRVLRSDISIFFAFAFFLLSSLSFAQTFTPLQAPPTSSAGAKVPANLALALSVEYPTGLQASYNTADYSPTVAYLGYFDNRKCYAYSTSLELFQPQTGILSTGACPTASHWSGNLLNWVSMTNIDQFRSVLTGGTRDSFSDASSSVPGDSNTHTVLIKSFSDRNANFVDRNLTNGTNGLPNLDGSRNLVARLAGFGTKMVVSRPSGTFPAMGSLALQKNRCSATTLNANQSCFNMRVQVCIAVAASGSAPAVGREDNCVVYGSNYKPEGLIQQYADTIRYAALGYTTWSDNAAQGAPLRAAMKSVGQKAYVSGGTLVTNTAAEWSSSTGAFITNPNPSDTTFTGSPATGTAQANVNNSGVINYLNKFGYSNGYKGYDPVSELYFAALTYLQGIAPPSTFSAMNQPTDNDDFPMITGTNLLRGNSRDPIIESCQKNFILTIGDVNTWCDGNVPGSNNDCSPGAAMTAANGIDVESSWSAIKTLEGITSFDRYNSAHSNTPYVAAMAYWANTNDIRTDLTNANGTQTVQSFFVDVLENNNAVSPPESTASYTLKTQYWLGAKYGGFDTVIAGGSNPNTTATSWDANGDGVPDNWYAGNNPKNIRSGLKGVFDTISSKGASGSSGAPSVSSSRQMADTIVINTGYESDKWTGKVTACNLTQNSTSCASNPVWEASLWLGTKTFTSSGTLTSPLTASTRKIFTTYQNTGTFALSRMPFLWPSLNGSQTTSLGTSTVLDFLRGDRSNEGTTMRARGTTTLGDIVNSGAVYIAGRGAPYPATPAYLGHSEYRRQNGSRPGVVYAGANDGMLHAFDASNGKELWAYIPGSVYPNLSKLSSITFSHRYFLDSTPFVGDVQITSGTSTWSTILVGGLGGGGKAYYALDISNQSIFGAQNELSLSAMPLWELTSAQDADIGYTYNEPSKDSVTDQALQITKIASSASATGTWAVLLGNGYGSSAGAAALLMVNPANGTVIFKLTASAGSVTATNGLSTPTGFDVDGDGLVDTIYAGDLAGNMHKFQFVKTLSGNDVLASSGDTSATWKYIGKLYSTNRSITTAPAVTFSCDGSGNLVSFGTGRMLETADVTSTASQGFYSIIDKMPSSSLTIAPGTLAQISYNNGTYDNTTEVRTSTTPDLTNKNGWYMTFSNGEQVSGNPLLPPDTGLVTFTTTRIDASNFSATCQPSSIGYLMSVSLCQASGGLGVGANPPPTVNSTVTTTTPSGTLTSGTLTSTTTVTSTQTITDCYGNTSTSSGINATGVRIDTKGDLVASARSYVGTDGRVHYATNQNSNGGSSSISCLARTRLSWRELLSR